MFDWVHDGGYCGAMPDITYRPVTEDEYPAFATAIIEGFSDDVPDTEFPDLLKSTLPPERTLAAFEGNEIVGTFGGYALDVSVPGGHVPMEGTTVVTVFPTHRRTGLMAEMMQIHLDSAVANGYPVAGLWSSQSSIYGQFGYGAASYAHSITLRAADIVFRSDIEIDRVRRISAEDAPSVLPAVFDAVLSTTSGMYARSKAWWNFDVLHDADWNKRGKTGLRFVVHDGPDGPEGYAMYRQKGGESDDGHANGTVHVIEVIAGTDRAHASLWSYLTSIDGCPNIKSWNCPVDDPLATKLVEPRRVRVESRFDALWILILDVVAALEARTYERDGSIRFTVANAYRTDVEGTYELSITNGAATCVRTEGDADLALDLDVLGAIYLGGADAHAYAAADRIRGDVEAIHRLNGLFHTARAPWCNQVF